jgi:cell division protease FtsH
VSRGFGALGYVMQLPLEDRYMMTASDLRHQLAVLLGGRTSEEVALGEVSTGAQNDLQRATDLARAMVTEYGMSPEMGLVSYDSARRRALFLDVPGGNERGPYAEDTAQRIDAEVRRIIDEAHDTARSLLTEHRDELEALTARLLEKEVLDGDEVRALLGLPPAQSHPPVPLPAPAD